MGSITRARLRIDIARQLRLGASGIATGGSTSTLIDVTTPSLHRDTEDYWNGSLLRIAGGTGGPGPELLSEAAGTKTETSGAVVDVASTTDPVDASCIKITTSATAGSAGSLSIATGTTTITAGREYVFSAWVKGSDVSSPQLEIEITGGADIIAKQSVNVTKAEWTRVVRTVRAPTGCTNITVILHGAADLSQTVYWDKPSLRLLGEVAYITDWVNTNSGTYTASFTFPTQPTAPAAGSEYELFYKTFMPYEYDEAINAAIRRLWPRIWVLRQDTSITTTSGNYAYMLPESVELPLLKVEIEQDTSESTAPYQELTYWTVRETAGARTLQMERLPMSSRTLRLTYLGRVEMLETDFDELDDEYVPYVMAQAKAELFKTLLGKLSRSDRTQIGENIGQFSDEAEIELQRIQRQMPATRAHIDLRVR